MPQTVSAGLARAAVRSGAADARIRDAAVRLFAQRGFAGTGIRDIATEAGVTSAALYHWVGSKEQLLLEIMDHVLDALIDAAQGIAADLDRPEARLAALVEHHVWYHAVHQLATIVTDSELRVLVGDPRAAVIAQRDRYERVWRGVIGDGVSDGIFQVDDPRIATTALLQLCTGVAHWYRPTGPITLMRLCQIHADLALAMVRASRDGTPIRADELELPSPALAFGTPA